MSDEKKTVLRKLRFHELLDARRDLTDAQRRVGGRLLSLYNVKRGYAWPTYDRLAADLGVSPRSVMRAVQALSVKGLFEVRFSVGRGHANEYRPKWDALPEGCPYTAERDFEDAQKVTPESPVPDGENAKRAPEKVTFHARKGDISRHEKVTSGSPHPVYTSGLEIHPFRSKAAAPRSGSVAHHHRSGWSLSREERTMLGELQKKERAIKIGWLAQLTDDERGDLRDQLDSIADDYGGHEGHPVGGLAFRLCTEVETYLDYDDDGVPEYWRRQH